jgi:hypothetical protein
VEAAGWDEGKERDLLQKQATHSTAMAELMEVSMNPPLEENALMIAETGRPQVSTRRH